MKASCTATSVTWKTTALVRGRRTRRVPHRLLTSTPAWPVRCQASMISTKPPLARFLESFPFLQSMVHWIVSHVIRPARRLISGGPPRMAGSGEKERKVRDLILNSVPPGNPDAVLDAIDRYGWNTGFLMNIADRKGAIVDTVIDKYRPKVALELGGYIGYSAVRIARKLPPGGKLYSIDPNKVHVGVARAIIEHAGLSDKVQVVQGILQTAIPVLRQQGVQTVDFALIDHVKHLYLQDLLVLQKSGLLKQGSVVVGDNVLTPGSPEFRQHVKESPDYSTVEHLTNVEYSNYVPDIVTVSEYRGREGSH